jgi:hypothetical protein
MEHTKKRCHENLNPGGEAERPIMQISRQSGKTI